MASASSKTNSSLFLLVLFLSLGQSQSSFVPIDTSFQRRRQTVRCLHKKGKRSLIKCNRYYHTKLCSSTSSESKCDELTRILRRYGFGSRLTTFSNDDLSKLPMPAEMYEGGDWKLCLILSLRPASSSAPNGNEKPPLLDVLAMNDDGLLKEKKVVDIGQITTVWSDLHETEGIDALTNSLQTSFNNAQESLQNNIFPVEKAMQNLYNGRIANRSRPQSHNHRALTKKQIPKIASQCSNPPHLEDLLRSLLKVGEDRTSRIVDSEMATDFLYSEYCRNGVEELMIRRMVGAQVLTEDAVSGGRFKRRSCQFVGFNSEAQEVHLVNGGWIAVDPSIKASTEGRRAGQKFAATSNNANEDTNVKKPLILTAADERIAHRLECLAMGDVWSSESDREEDEKMLELDVRSALNSMDLPLSPQGATSALVKIGRWSENANNNDSKSKRMNKLIEPWSPDLLDAARSLSIYENNGRESLAKICFSPNKKRPNKANSSPLADGLEGRVDLSSLPCVCIDAKRATFRDDSIGIRLRSSTGRKVNKAASKWEILVHIADVSDIYLDRGKTNGNIILPGKRDANVHLLRQASERRGQSRYDLPLGPLHLLPPVALTALSLATNKEKTPNKCVTLWAYIDERDGKLLEAGLERTVISSPNALSFAEATTLLEGNAEDAPKSLSNAKAIISVAERNLGLWSQRHRQLNQAAQKRENRLSNKEFISKELNVSSGTRTRDDGVGGSFQRSRGHRMVDSSLDLYAFAVGTLMSRAKQPIPRAAGSGADRGGRLGTAPLRRYIDGIAQRQALSVLCGYGEPLSLDECREASKIAARASDTIANVRSSKDSPMSRSRGSGNQRRQVSSLYNLARHLASTGGIQNQQQVKAVSTGHNNEVVILGVGATARCKRVKGTLKSGEKLLVEVSTIDPEKGVLDVLLVQRIG
ncbi:hypothetical protein ACHAXR_007856 [Thalassiosira sp. AJA248-18]